MAKARIKVEDKIAQEIGEVFADFYIAIGEAVRTTLTARKRLRTGGLKLWESIPAKQRYEFLAYGTAVKLST